MAPANRTDGARDGGPPLERRRIVFAGTERVLGGAFTETWRPVYEDAAGRCYVLVARGDRIAADRVRHARVRTDSARAARSRTHPPDCPYAPDFAQHAVARAARDPETAAAAVAVSDAPRDASGAVEGAVVETLIAGVRKAVLSQAAAALGSAAPPPAIADRIDAFFRGVPSATDTPALRVGDADAKGNAIVAGDSSIEVEGAPIARVGDAVERGGVQVYLGAATVLSGGAMTARVGTSVSAEAPFPAGASKTFIGGATGGSPPPPPRGSGAGSSAAGSSGAGSSRGSSGSSSGGAGESGAKLPPSDEALDAVRGGHAELDAIGAEQEALNRQLAAGQIGDDEYFARMEALSERSMDVSDRLDDLAARYELPVDADGYPIAPPEPPRTPQPSPAPTPTPEKPSPFEWGTTGPQWEIERDEFGNPTGIQGHETVSGSYTNPLGDRVTGSVDVHTECNESGCSAGVTATGEIGTTIADHDVSVHGTVGFDGTKPGSGGVHFDIERTPEGGWAVTFESPVVSGGITVDPR